MYYLLLSGFIPEQKQVEFEQTCQLVSSQIPLTCAGFNFHRGKRSAYKYFFISYWANLQEVNGFMKSPVFMMLSGAFAALGELIEEAHGELNSAAKNRQFSSNIK